MKKSNKKLRKLGDITQDMEPLLLEMAVDHDMQAHEILGIVYAYLRAHVSSCLEEYDDGTQAVYYFGHKDGLK